MKFLVNRFKPSEKGLEQIFGELESEIMEAVWLKKKATVRDILENLQKNREIAYTTVMTVMARLNKKGFLVKSKDGQAFLYSATISKEELKENTVKKVLQGLLTDSTDMAMAHFVDEISKDRKSLEQLQALINERLEE